ncbi:MAG TPA: flagellar protein FlaG [Vicinamibacterales bacterium]|nr:flagellar protein FlaG [Vicinamibacterales bacterium]
MKIGEATTIEMKLRNAARPQQVEVPAARAAATEPRQTRSAPPVEIPKIESVTRQIDSYLRSINRSLQFRLDQATGQMVVSICDAETGEVIRQVPGEEALRIAQRIEHQLSTMLDEKA